MTRLLIALSDSRETIADYAAIAKVVMVAEADGTPVNGPWSWEGGIPSGGDGRPVELAGPGVYEIFAQLPSGGSHVAQVIVGDGEDRVVWFRHATLPTPAPRISAKAAGDVAARQGRPAAAAALGRLEVAGLGRTGATGPTLRKKVIRRAGKGVPRLAYFTVDGRSDASWRLVSEGHGLHGSRPVMEALDEALARGGAKLVTSSNEPPPRWNPDAPRGGRIRTFVIRPGRDVEIESWPSCRPWVANVSTATSSLKAADIENLLAFVARRELRLARKQLDDLLDCRRWDGFVAGVGPLAAAVAAHVVSLTAVSDEGGWADALHRFMMAHPWLPDGAVAFARYRLRFVRNRSDVVAGRSALVAAFRRGIPFCALGVESLADGLLLVTDGSPKIGSMSRAATRLRASIDPARPFTVFQPA